MFKNFYLKQLKKKKEKSCEKKEKNLQNLKKVLYLQSWSGSHVIKTY